MKVKISTAIIIIIFLTSENIHSKTRKHKKRKSYTNNYLYINPGVFSGSINVEDLSNNSKAEIISKTNYTITAKWVQKWDKPKQRKSKQNSFLTNIFLNYNRISYVKPSTRTLTNGSLNIFNFGLGFTYSIFHNFDINFDTFYGDEYYFRAPNVNSITFDLSKVYGFRSSIDWDIYHSYPFVFGINGGYEKFYSSKINGDYSSKSNYKYFGSIYLKYGRYLCKFIYKNSNKDTTYFNQNYKFLYFLVSTKWLL